MKKEQREILDDAREPTACWPVELTARGASEFAHIS